MKITLHNFQCYTDAVFDFESGKVTYIEGVSGSGKTTIFEAIKWTLYGSKNSKKVCNWLNPKEKTYCLLNFGSINVYRQKNPKDFRVLLPLGEELIGTAAQEAINKLCGTEDVWTSTCYVMEDGYHPLVSCNPSTRAELLDHIAFDGGDPGKYIKNHRKLLKETSVELTTVTARYETENSSYESLIDKIKPQESWLLEEDEEKKLEKEIETLSDLLPKLQSQQNRLSADRSRHSYLNEEKKKILAKLDSLDGIPVLEQTLKVKKQQFAIQEKREVIENELIKIEKELSTLPGDSINITSNDVISIMSQEQEYKKQSSSALSLQVEYTLQSIQNKIKEIEHTIDVQPLINKKERHKELTEQISKLQRRKPNMPSQQIEEIKTNLSNLSMSSSARRSEINKELNQKMSEIISHQTLKQKEMSEELNKSSNLLKSEYQAKQKEKKEKYTQNMNSLTDKAKTFEIEITQIQDVKTCPHCNNHVRIVRNQLVPVSNKIEYTMQQLEENLQAIKKQILATKEDFASSNHHLEKELANKLHQLEVEIKNRYNLDNYIKNYQQTYIIPLQKELETISTQEEIKRKELENVLQQWRTYQDIIKQEEAYLNEIKSLGDLTHIPTNIKKLTQQEIKQLQSTLNQLKNIRIIEKPQITSSYAKQLLRKSELINQKSQLENELSPLQLQQSTSKREIETLISNIAVLKQHVTRLEEINKELKTINYQEDSYEQVSKHFIESTQIIQKNRLLLSQSKDAKYVLERYDKVIELSNEMDRIYNDVLALKEMERIAIETQSIAHTEIISSINSFLEVLSPFVFDDPISLSIQATTILRSGVEKPKVNLEICYKGGELVDVFDLSKGEKKRISILIALAFCVTFGNKLLILDEGLSGLDEQKQNSIIRLLCEEDEEKRIIPRDVVVLMTSHGCNKGKFGAIITPNIQI